MTLLALVVAGWTGTALVLALGLGAAVGRVDRIDRAELARAAAPAEAAPAPVVLPASAAIPGQRRAVDAPAAARV